MSENHDTTPENVVYVGSKPIVGYSMNVLTLFQTHDEVILKARGRAISHAVDVAEVVRKRFMAGQCDIKEIKTDTETVVTREGKPSNISSIEITLVKTNKS